MKATTFPSFLRSWVSLSLSMPFARVLYPGSALGSWKVQQPHNMNSVQAEEEKRREGKN